MPFDSLCIHKLSGTGSKSRRKSRYSLFYDEKRMFYDVKCTFLDVKCTFHVVK